MNYVTQLLLHFPIPQSTLALLYAMSIALHHILPFQRILITGLTLSQIVRSQHECCVAVALNRCLGLVCIKASMLLREHQYNRQQFGLTWHNVLYYAVKWINVHTAHLLCRCSFNFALQFRCQSLSLFTIITTRSYFCCSLFSRYTRGFSAEWRECYTPLMPQQRRQCN